MKRLSTLTIMLSLTAFMYAQGISKIGATDPEFLPEFNTNNVTVTGLSNDGRYIYGTDQSGSAAIYDYMNITSDPMYKIEAGQADYLGINVSGFTPDGKVLVSHYFRSYFLDMSDGTETEIESPDPNYGLDAWAISTDGRYIGCNLTNDEFFVIPMVAEKQEDGTYKLIELEYDPYDAMGCPAQYTQVRFISEDGSYIIGIQPDNRGMGGRLVVWERLEDGTYKFTTPLDEFIYDLTMEKPGLAPEYEDFVTADYETEPELFQQQYDEFDKAFNEYEEKYNKFTRNQSALEIYLMNKATRSNIICMGFYDNRVNCDMNMIPLYYNCDTHKVTDVPDMVSSFGINALPGGGFIAATDQGGLNSLTAIDETGEKQPFETWFKENTDIDLAKDYTFTFYDFMTDTEVEGVFPGIPYFSNDGQTLVLSGTDPDSGTIASVIKFDSDIFATATGISSNVVSKVTFGNNKIMIGDGKQGVAEVFTLSGAKCGSYTVNGTFDFNTVLSKGAYIVKMNVADEKPISMKIIVK